MELIYKLLLYRRGFSFSSLEIAQEMGRVVELYLIRSLYDNTHYPGRYQNRKKFF
jgi:hypothetical protein